MTLAQAGKFIVQASALNAIILNVAFNFCYAKCLNAECRYAECRYAERLYADSRGAINQMGWLKAAGG